MMMMMHELALDFGLFPLLLDDADVLPCRAPALCQSIITISSSYPKTTFGKVWGRVGPWPKLARPFVLKVWKFAK
jgi:hypothetical protein